MNDDITPELEDIDDSELDAIDEEIDPIEVDTVLATLSDLIERVKSQTIREYLEATCSDIAYLIEDDEELESEQRLAS